MPASSQTGFSAPSRKCDIVMKGGITSGIVYPHAICTLAATYRFQNIGGTSAGAIAAAAAAAAEYRRACGSPEGFEILSGLPDFLASTPGGSKHTNLYWLFQPHAAVRLLFDVGVALTQRGLKMWSSLLFALFRGAPAVWIFTGILIALFFGLPAFAASRHTVFGILSAILWVALAWLCGHVMVFAAKLRLLPALGFGICSGLTTLANGRPALTDWFHDFLSRVSGKSPQEPLTFGDLHLRGIQLRMISTCFTHGRPYGLPIDTVGFFFRREEFEQYFPHDVVQWMVDHPGPPSQTADGPPDDTGFYRLPAPADLPVIVAARMSLSFPLLFRAVPLYAVDCTLHRQQPGEPPVPSEPGGALSPGEPRRPELCWFLDGGLCSNFPIQMFDATLPRWPTFGIDLQPVRKDRPAVRAWMPSRNEEGMGEIWNRISSRPALASVLQYLLGMVDAARNWNDNRQMSVPGYRDRIVHIYLDDKMEGGLSLDMPREVVQDVSGRGHEAAALLLSHFDHPAPEITLDWDNHRWIRFRSSLGRFQETILEFADGLEKPEPGDRTYTDLMNRGQKDPPDAYHFTPGQLRFAAGWLEFLNHAARKLNAAGPPERPNAGEPVPPPVMRVTPRTVPRWDAEAGAAPKPDPSYEGIRAVQPDPSSAGSGA